MLAPLVSPATPTLCLALLTCWADGELGGGRGAGGGWRMEASDLLYCSLIASDAVCPGLRTISSLPSGAADGLGVLLFLLLGLIELAVSSVTSTALDAELDGTPS